MASMFTNPYDAQIAQQEASQDRALAASKVPWYQRGAYEGTKIGEEFGRNLGGMMGMQTPEDAKQAKIQEIMGQYGEGAKTVKQLQDIAGDFGNAGMMDLMQETLSMIDKIEPKQTTAKKWQTVREDKRTDIRAEALRRGYKLPEDIIRSIANSSPDVSQVSNTTDTFIHPWMNALEAQLVGRKQYEGFMSGTAESTPASQATDTTPEKRASIELNRAETMRTKYNTEVADYKTNFESASSGLVNVKLHREGNNQSALPNITKNLAQMFNDKKLSQPEVKHAMSFGGLGERVVRKFSLWMSGELPPGDLNDIEEMFRRVALVSQQQMNAKTVDFRTRYGDKMSKKNLNSFLPAIATIPLTQQQRLEALKEQKRLRGI